MVAPKTLCGPAILVLVAASCDGARERLVENPRPAEACIVPVSETRRLIVFQDIDVGCAVLPVVPDWRLESVGSLDLEGFAQDGVLTSTPVLFTRTSCANARTFRPGDLPAELGREPSGFLSVTQLATNQGLLSVSLDFLAEGSPDVQNVRIRDLFLTLDEGEHDYCVY
jgi:hypothetical protein